MNKMMGVAAAVVVGIAGLVASGCGGGDNKGASTPAPTTENIAINHVEKGCHVWNNGQAAMQVQMNRGDTLGISNKDIDNHQLVEMNGPMMGMGGMMKMVSGTASMTFTEPGTYHFKTKVVEEKGSTMRAVETIGPDNDLTLEVVVS